MFAAAACSRGQSGKAYSIGVVPKGTTHEFWKSIHAGAVKAARERSRFASLVPPMHVALLSTSRICVSLADALARVDVASHAVTLITGPSRTSDIELTLVVGVHGPQMVHVLLLEET